MTSFKELDSRIKALEDSQPYKRRMLGKHDRQIERILELIGSMDLDQTQRQQLVRAIRGSEDE